MITIIRLVFQLVLAKPGFNLDAPEGIKRRAFQLLKLVLTVVILVCFFGMENVVQIGMDLSETYALVKQEAEKLEAAHGGRVENEKGNENGDVARKRP
ncbi:hypothetical protein LPN04_31530 [Rugamonas sp. A1-17]|nr:hypothetical protein [Rugamonas sp. A1-17]